MNESAQPFGPQSGDPRTGDYLPTEDERNFAMLAHVLQFFAGFIPPLVIYLVKRNSRFVAFHALQALFWQITYFVIIMLGMVIIFATMFGTLVHQLPKGATNNTFPVGIFLGMGAFWLVFMMGWVVNVVLAIYYGIKAHQGKWAAYPILGRWARRIANG
jgi:uncharacterized Tic20 family protein